MATAAAAAATKGGAASRPLAAGPGRPKDPGKRRAILDAAGHLFHAQGLEAVTMEGVAAAAGVSKVTVYGHFGDKAALFEAVVLERTAAMAAALAELEASGAPLPDALPRFGVQLLTFLTRPDLIAFDRLLAGEAHRHPELARRFFDAGPGRMRAALGRVIEGGARRGEVTGLGDPRAAAEDLCALWQGMLPIELRLGLRGPPDPGEIEARARHGVGIFLRAHPPARHAP